MHQHTWGVTQIMLCFQSGCCFPGAATDLQHVRGQHSAHPPPCASHWYGVGRAPLFRAHVRAEVSKVWFMLRSVLGSQPSLCMHKVLVPLNVFTLQMKKASELININIMCIALATWHLIQKLKINYVNHPRWEALQEIDLLLLLPEEQIIWNQDKSKQPEVKQYKTKAPFPRQVSADFQVLCAGSETVGILWEWFTRAVTGSLQKLNWFPNTPFGISLHNQILLNGLFILLIFSHLMNLEVWKHMLMNQIVVWAPVHDAHIE